MSDKTTEGTRARRCWEVVAGIIPGLPIQEHTRRWVITGEYWERINEMTDEEFTKAHPDGKSSYVKFGEEAQEYARSLIDPRGLTWVRVDWIWF
jgi:hypothetical protein